MNNYTRKYDDIINLSHHVSMKHPRMSLEARSAQFAPFAALTGYSEAIKETARLTEEQIEVDENVKIILDYKLQIIKEKIVSCPLVTITYFVLDSKKAGGAYINNSGNIVKIDDYRNLIIMNDGTEISISEIVDITGDVFKEEWD